MPGTERKTLARSVGPKSDDDERLTRALIERIRCGDNQAFSELVRHYWNQVASLAYRMLGDYDEAADVSQTVFLKMSRNIWRYDEKRRFSTWLYRITANASIDHIRKHRRHRHEPIEDFQNALESQGDDPEFDFHCRQLRSYIDKAAQGLSDKQRSAFVLRDVQGRKVDDVASIMKIPQTTARWYVQRAREKIRRELIRQCPHLLTIMGVSYAA
jgi:RNA polymerase sigma-70 factor (ECF subfamily)